MKKSKKSRGQNSSLPLIILILGMTLILVAAVIFTQGGNVTPIDQDAIPRVNPLEAETAVEESNAILVDVRDAASYNELHAQGAINIPLSELPDRLDELDPKRWIITYCT